VDQRLICACVCLYANYEVGLFESNVAVNVLVFEISSDCFENWK